MIKTHVYRLLVHFVILQQRQPYMITLNTNVKMCLFYMIHECAWFILNSSKELHQLNQNWKGVDIWKCSIRKHVELLEQPFYYIIGRICVVVQYRTIVQFNELIRLTVHIRCLSCAAQIMSILSRADRRKNQDTTFILPFFFCTRNLIIYISRTYFSIDIHTN